MSRYVILHHELPSEHPRESHWDLMLEDGATLRTWALAEAPVLNRMIAAEPLPNHRAMYLDYEGPIEGDRGQVTRWDHGEFEWRTRSTDRVDVVLRGERLTARVTLIREISTQRWSFQASPIDSAKRG